MYERRAGSWRNVTTMSSRVERNFICTTHHNWYDARVHLLLTPFTRFTVLFKVKCKKKIFNFAGITPKFMDSFVFLRDLNTIHCLHRVFLSISLHTLVKCEISIFCVSHKLSFVRVFFSPLHYSVDEVFFLFGLCLLKRR